MLAEGFVIAHRDWAPGRKSDIDPASLGADRNWAPTAAPEEDDDMQVSDLNAAATAGQLDDFFTRQAQVSARYGLARGVDIRTAVAPLLAAISSAGVESGKRDAAVLAVLATLGKPQELSPEEFAAALAPLLAEQGVALSEATIARAVRTELAGALAGP